jgi:S-formylglutathione hydrolase FrmB
LLTLLSFVLASSMCGALLIAPPLALSIAPGTALAESIDATPARESIPASVQERLIAEYIAAPSLEGNLLGDSAEKPILVCLPPSYFTSGARYPVVYFLPGYSTDIQAFVTGIFQGLKLQESMDRLIAEGIVEEMIIVLPKGQHALAGAFYVDSPVTGDWEAFVVEDLVAHVDSHYRTLPDRDSRGIAGHSMGGYGALNLSMLHPDVFGSAYALSPGLFDPDGLRNSQMFSTQSMVDAFLALESKLTPLSKEEAHQEFVATDDLGGELRFAIAYGMAFSPDAEGNAPYVNYPYQLTADGIDLDDRVWDTWEAGFGGTVEEVERYRDNLLSLNGLVVDYGGNDFYGWIPQGCEHYSRVLSDAGIHHSLVRSEGGHSDGVREAIEERMLPWFSGVLVFE